MEQLQCFFLSRCTRKVTPKNVYLHDPKKCFLGRSIQKNILFNFENGSTEQLGTEAPESYTSCALLNVIPRPANLFIAETALGSVRKLHILND